MSEKNFYSFYKLNDEETAKLKEKTTENNKNPDIINATNSLWNEFRPAPEEKVTKETAPTKKAITKIEEMANVTFGVFCAYVRIGIIIVCAVMLAWGIANLIY